MLPNSKFVLTDILSSMSEHCLLSHAQNCATKELLEEVQADSAVLHFLKVHVIFQSEIYSEQYKNLVAHLGRR